MFFRLSDFPSNDISAIKLMFLRMDGYIKNIFYAQFSRKVKEVKEKF